VDVTIPNWETVTEGTITAAVQAPSVITSRRRSRCSIGVDRQGRLRGSRSGCRSGHRDPRAGGRHRVEVGTRLAVLGARMNPRPHRPLPRQPRPRRRRRRLRRRSPCVGRCSRNLSLLLHLLPHRNQSRPGWCSPRPRPIPCRRHLPARPGARAGPAPNRPSHHRSSAGSWPSGGLDPATIQGQRPGGAPHPQRRARRAATAATSGPPGPSRSPGAAARGGGRTGAGAASPSRGSGAHARRSDSRTRRRDSRTRRPGSVTAGSRTATRRAAAHDEIVPSTTSAAGPRSTWSAPSHERARDTSVEVDYERLRAGPRRAPSGH